MLNLQPIFSVSELHEVVNNHLSLLGPIQVQGELSEIKISQNKWVFMTLKDDSSVVSLFGISYQLQNLPSLAVGMQVQVSGIPKMYPKYGKFSLFIQTIMPVGEGSLKIAFEKLRLLLENEGLFDPSHKRPLPAIPEKIGLLTAPDSQAAKDFIKVATNRFPTIQIELLPIQVQGNQAASTIITQLQSTHKRSDLDVLVLTRGGGSAEDLASFNDEAVVRAVFASKLPLVCAIGHEGDISLAELAADVRASTPSNAAELTVPSRGELLNHLSHLVDQGYKHCLQQHANQTQRLNWLIYRMEKRILTQMQQVEACLSQTEHQVKIQRLACDNFLDRLTYLETSMVGRVTNQNQKLLALLEVQESSLNNLDIKQVLARGYSITTNSVGQIITHIDQVKPGESLWHQLNNGRIKTTINKLEKTL